MIPAVVSSLTILVLGLTAAFAPQQSGLMAASAVLALLVCWLLIFDLISIKRSLLNLISRGSGATCDRLRPVKPPLSSLGQQCRQLLDWLQLSRAAGMNEENENSEIDVQKFMDSRQRLGTKEKSDHGGNTLHRALDRFRLRARVPVSALIWHDHGSLQVLLSGKGSARLEAQLRGIFEPFFLHADSSMLGARDGHAAESLLGEFSIFGYRHTWSAELRNSSGSEPIKMIVWVGFSAEFIPGHPEISRLRSLLGNLSTDVTHSAEIAALEERVNEAQREQRDRSELIAQLSHDLRSPLSNIKGILNVMQLESRDAQISDMLEAALKNCENVAELIQDLLDYSRHQFGKLVARRENCDIRELAAQAVKSFAFSAKAKGLDLAAIVDLDDPLEVCCDSSHFKRIISNLLSNAIKYTRHGKIELRVTAVSSECVRISVKDSGMGMSPVQVQRLFTPFTRFHHDIAEGVGLGLALAKILTEVNGGSISASSLEGRGSEFEVLLPAAAACVAKQALSAQRKGFPHCAVAGLKVLVVDDDADCVSTMARALSSRGIDVLQAVSVPDALSIINFERLDAVISDSAMPHGGGEAVVEAAQLRNPGIKVLVLSGSADSAPRHFVRMDSAEVTFMSKPADITKIFEWLAFKSGVTDAEGWQQRAVGGGAG